MGGEGTSEVKYQAVKFIPLSNNKVNVIKKEQFYSNIFRKG